MWITQGYNASPTAEVRWIRLLRQVPAITELAQLDATGEERLRQSKLAMDVQDSHIDFSHEAKFTEAAAKKVYYGPVYFRGKSEPYMTLALAGIRRDAGISIAKVNLKLVWDLVMQMKVGEHGFAYIVDAEGRVVQQLSKRFFWSRSSAGGAAGSRTQRVEVAHDIRSRQVLTANASVGQPDWFVFVEQPTDEVDATAIRR
jgi:hypothetical protein